MTHNITSGLLCHKGLLLLTWHCLLLQPVRTRIEPNTRMHYFYIGTFYRPKLMEMLAPSPSYIWWPLSHFHYYYYHHHYRYHIIIIITIILLIIYKYSIYKNWIFGNPKKSQKKSKKYTCVYKIDQKLEILQVFFKEIWKSKIGNLEKSNLRFELQHQHHKDQNKIRVARGSSEGGFTTYLIIKIFCLKSSVFSFSLWKSLQVLVLLRTFFLVKIREGSGTNAHTYIHTCMHTYMHIDADTNIYSYIIYLNIYTITIHLLIYNIQQSQTRVTITFIIR